MTQEVRTSGIQVYFVKDTIQKKDFGDSNAFHLFSITYQMN